jgi:hypothetical protein
MTQLTPTWPRLGGVRLTAVHLQQLTSMDVPPLFYACICFCMGSGDPLHTPRALGTAGHLAGTFPHQLRGQGLLPFRRFPHQRVRSRLLFLVGLLLSGPRNLVLSQAHRKVSLRSSVLYFLGGRRSSASTSTAWLKLLLLCVFLSRPPTCPLLQVRLRKGDTEN